MTAQVIDFATREHVELAPTHRMIVPVTPWWTCPSWCAGDCMGGDTVVFNDTPPGITTDRLHERLVYRTRGTDDLDGTPVGVMVTLERNDSIAEPGATEVLLKVGAEGVLLTRAQRIELAAALLAANDLDEAA